MPKSILYGVRLTIHQFGTPFLRSQQTPTVHLPTFPKRYPTMKGWHRSKWMYTPFPFAIYQALIQISQWQDDNFNGLAPPMPAEVMYPGLTSILLRMPFVSEAQVPSRESSRYYRSN